MKVQRVEWHSYQLVYEYEIPDEEIEEKFGDRSDFKYFLFEHILDGGSKKVGIY